MIPTNYQITRALELAERIAIALETIAMSIQAAESDEPEPEPELIAHKYTDAVQEFPGGMFVKPNPDYLQP